MFAATGLGLNNGMVICFDDHGHVAVEAAHVQHVHRHADGEGHGDDDLGLDPDHDALHDAIASCFDAHVGQARHSAPVHDLRLGDPTAPTPLIITKADLPASPISNRCGDLRGATARAELACLSGIVLLV
jgi:hypothetical protein